MREDVLLWLGATVILFIAEAVTVNLVTVWFALGALAAFIAAVAGAQLWLQLLLFFAVTVLTLIFTRPIAKKHINGKHEATNADAVIGKVAVVTEDIDNLAAAGTVSCMGKIWTARSENGEKINAGEKVTVKKIQGVKLIVLPLNKE
ncbi:MAG: NfeD family protein [Clostridia bacterium]|nr:NfeD family protein [Clostridia bacterium]